MVNSQKHSITNCQVQSCLNDCKESVWATCFFQPWQISLLWFWQYSFLLHQSAWLWELGKERKWSLSWEVRAVKYFVVSATSVLVTRIWRSINKFYKRKKLQMCTSKVSFHLCQLTHCQKKAKLLSSKESNTVFIHFIDISKRTRVVCVFRAAHDLWLTMASLSYFVALSYMEVWLRSSVK